MRTFMCVAAMATSITFSLFGQTDSVQLSTAQQSAVGAISGFITAACVKPLLYVKNQLQQANAAKAWSADPRVWYRGFPVFASSLTPITSVQTAASDAVSKVGLPEVAGGIIGGGAGGLLSGPSELGMMHQENTGKSLMQVAKELTAKHGPLVLSRGIVPTVVREGFYGAGYLWTVPAFKSVINRHTDNDLIAYPAASAAGGFVTTAVTLPFDVTKTVMQNDIDQKQYRGVWNTMQQLYKAEGIRAFSRGFAPRFVVVSLAVGGKAAVNEKLTNGAKIYNQKRAQKQEQL